MGSILASLKISAENIAEVKEQIVATVISNLIAAVEDNTEQLTAAATTESVGASGGGIAGYSGPAFRRYEDDR